MIRSSLQSEDLFNQVRGRYQFEYDHERAILTTLANTGFFSNCTFVLLALLHLAHLGVAPLGISFRRGFGNFTDSSASSDLYEQLFATDSLEIQGLRSTVIPLADLVCPDHHTNYAVLPYSKFTPFIRAYFQPSPMVRATIEHYIEAYSINFEETVAICYRGTDKSTEVKLASPQIYLDAALKIIKPGMRVLIQTDQLQAKQFFLDRIPGSFALDEMPATAGSRVLHLLPEHELSVTKGEFARRLVAATILVSKCRHIVNHCGNMAMWIALFRGSSNGMKQVDRHGNLVGPLQIAEAKARNLARRVRRSIRGDIAYFN